MELLKPIKLSTKTVLPFIYGKGNQFFAIGMRFVDEIDLTKSEKENYLAGDSQADLYIYFDQGLKNLSLPHWQGYCYMVPEYFDPIITNKLIDYLLDQKIIQKPAAISFTGWDRSGKVQGSVTRLADDDQDIFIGSD